MITGGILFKVTCKIKMAFFKELFGTVQAFYQFHTRINDITVYYDCNKNVTLYYQYEFVIRNRKNRIGTTRMCRYGFQNSFSGLL